MSYISCQEDDDKRLDDSRNSKVHKGFLAVPSQHSDPIFNNLTEEIEALKKQIQQLKDKLVYEAYRRQRAEHELREKQNPKQGTKCKTKSLKQRQKPKKQKASGKPHTSNSAHKKQVSSQSKKAAKKQTVLETKNSTVQNRQEKRKKETQNSTNWIEWTSSV